jgi:iron complex outermembrane receptor protein
MARLPAFCVAFGVLTGPAVAAPALDDIVVTARGRAEALIRVPDTVTAFSAADLAERKLTTLDEILAATPGVFLVNDQDPGTNLITIRGVSTNRNQSASVAFVVDGLALPDTELFTLRPYDLVRVEVLKGPQGALYGRSASGGVISFVTAQPGEGRGSFVSVGLGNGLTATGDAALDLALGERVALRAATSLRTSDGFIRNTFLGFDVDGATSLNGRIAARWQVSEAVRWTVRAAVARETGGAAFISSNNVTGRFGGRLAGAALTNPFGDFEGRADRTWWGLQSTLVADLGGVTLTSITGFDDYRKDFVEELDFRNDKPITFFGAPVFPDGLQPIRQPIDVRAVTQQLRLTSADTARLRWIAGGFFQHSRRLRTDDFGPLLFGAPALQSRTRSTQIGVFAQGALDLTDTLELSAALRYDRDRRRERLVGAVSRMQVSDRAATFDRWQPKVSLAWRPADTLTAYVTGSVGFKAGGFNPLPGPADIWTATFPSERTRGLEAGVKAELADGRVRFDLAGFLTDYANYQNTAFLGGNSVVLSVPQVDVSGIEASAVALLGAGFRAEGSLALTRSKIGRYTTPNPTPEPGEPAILNFQGNWTPHAPEYTAQAAVVWEGTVALGTLSARLDYNRLGAVRYEVDNILVSPARGWLDARITLTRGPLELELWAKNLTDERWAISAFGQQQLALLLGLGPNGPFDSFTINPGRQWGVSAGWRF